MTGTKACPLTQQVDILCLPTQKRAHPGRVSQAQVLTSVPALFAEGVDIGVELALHWMEQELASSELSVDSFQSALDAIRRLFQQVQQSSFQTALPVSPASTHRSRRRSSARARSVAAGC